MDFKKELVEHQTKIQMAPAADDDRLDFLIAKKIQITEQLSELENKLAPFTIEKERLENELMQKNSLLIELENTQRDAEIKYRSSLKIIKVYQRLAQNQENLEANLEALHTQKEAIENQLSDLQDKYPNANQPLLDILAQHEELKETLAKKNKELDAISDQYHKMQTLKTSQFRLIRLFVKIFHVLRRKPDSEKLLAQLTSLEEEIKELSKKLREYEDLTHLDQLKKMEFQILTEQADNKKLIEAREIVNNYSREQSDLNKKIKNIKDAKSDIEKKITAVAKNFKEVDKLTQEKNKIEQEWHQLDNKNRTRPELIKKFIKGLINISDRRDELINRKTQRQAGKNNQLFKDHVEKNQPETKNIPNQTSLIRLTETIGTFLNALDNSTAEYNILNDLKNTLFKYSLNNVRSEYSTEKNKEIEAKINKLISDLPADNPLTVPAVKNYIHELIKQPEPELASSKENRSFSRK